MNALQEYSSEEDLNLHISFQLVGDTTYKSQKEMLEAALQHHLGDIFALEYEDPADLPERELVYKVSKPIILEKTMLRNYFQNLKELFEATERFLPAFTQSSEAKA